MIEFWGCSIERIIRACELVKAPTPEWQVSGGDCWAIFHFSNANQLSVLTNPVSDPVTDPVSDPVVELDTVDRLVVLLQYQALAPKELQAALGLKHRPTFRKN